MTMETTFSYTAPHRVSLIRAGHVVATGRLGRKAHLPGAPTLWGACIDRTLITADRPADLCAQVDDLLGPTLRRRLTDALADVLEVTLNLLMVVATIGSLGRF